ncbi:MAG: GTP-binding protein, partial [Psychromonas sp.]
KKHSPKLASKPRWLVFNKTDLLLEDEAKLVIERVKEALEWDGPVYKVAAISKTGTHSVCRDVVEYLEELPAEFTPEEERQQVEFQWDDYHQTAIEDADEDDDDWSEDDEMMEVIYTKE